jgi:hypothetical protein
MPIKYTDKELELTKSPETLDEICAAVSCGGTLPEWCALKGARFGIIAPWINGDPERLKAFSAATIMRGEWFEAVIFKQLRDIAQVDIRGALNDDGSVKPVSEWPEDLAAAVSGMKHSATTDKDGNAQENSEIKLLDKLRSLELLMKNRRMLSDRLEVSGKVSLESLVEASRSEISS